MDRYIDTSEYGICIWSMGTVTGFLKNERIRSNKLLALFQKNKKVFLKLVQNGVWIPIPQIDSESYFIKIKNLGEGFDDQWEQVFEYGDFNLEITDGLWISDTGSFLKFDEQTYPEEGYEYEAAFGIKHYDSNKERWYITLNGCKIYSDVWVDMPSGKYLLTIRGYARKEITDKKAVNYGYQFELKEVNVFESFNNPREDKYNFNIGSILRKRS